MHLIKPYQISFIVLLCIVLMACTTSESSNSLWEHLPYETQLDGSKGLDAEFLYETKNRTLYITNTQVNKYNWCSILPPQKGWDLSAVQFVEAEFTNAGDSQIELLFWVHANKGWDAVASSAILKPGESQILSCNLRETFPDGTPKINPACIDKIQFMLVKAESNARLVVSGLKTKGFAQAWQSPEGRLEVPDLSMGHPEAGKRVPYSLSRESDVYGLLYLPVDWIQKKKYPLIVEFPGNIFFTTGCYSTGRPEQCSIGYGMSKGENAIWLSLPFVSQNKMEIAESGWGHPEYTTEFAYRLINQVCDKFNVDKEKIILTGFSRGAIACGFIGLRNDSIASLWKGIHACQHYDGDGWGKANMDEAIQRLKRGKDIPQFHTDNNNEQPKLMFKEDGIDVVFEDSGLGAHACAMFLDDRKSTLKLREWFKKLVE